MGKSVFIAEKPSVAQEFAKALKVNLQRKDGYLEGENVIVTWCVGHLVTMSYPEAYDPALKKWSLDTLPFLPGEFKYEVIPSVKKQFAIVKEILTRKDVETIYVCTDSGREGEYIYRLVAQMSGVKGKKEKRVWIDSQTEEEILRGIREAKDLSAYDNLGSSAYLRAKEDYLMGINFSRVLSLQYGNSVNNYLGGKYQAIAVGRVMTCVLGMVVRREREIRDFVKTPFYRVLGSFNLGGHAFEGEWKSVPGSKYEQSPWLYKENGFKEREKAEELCQLLTQESEKNGREHPVTLQSKAAGGQSADAGSAGMDAEKNAGMNADMNPGMAAKMTAQIAQLEKKKEKKNPPLLYNLAELQNDCSRMFKISPDETLRVVQELYEKKLVTYPRTDARVLSTAVAKEINRNIKGLIRFDPTAAFAQEILEKQSFKGIEKTRYVNDKQITDHYAIIPTGQGLNELGKLSQLSRSVYQVIVRRFLSIFYPAAVYEKINLVTQIGSEKLFSNFKVLVEEGYLKVAQVGSRKKNPEEETDEEKEEERNSSDQNLLQAVRTLKKGMYIPVDKYNVKEQHTSPPKRYNSGTMILAMENAGQLIEDESLREEIKGSGIGTSATRAEILKKLVTIGYLQLNNKTQVITPELQGEMVYDVVYSSIRPLLNPELTASWEKGLTGVAEGTITTETYMQKLEAFISRRTDVVKGLNNQIYLRQYFDAAARYYSPAQRKAAGKRSSGRAGTGKKRTAGGAKGGTSRKTTVNKQES